MKLRELQFLVGRLNFACSVVRPVKTFLRRLIDLTKGVKKPHHTVKRKKSGRLDIKARKSFIDTYNWKYLFLDDVWLTPEKLRRYTDAAGSHGFAAILGLKYLFGECPGHLKGFDTT